MYISIANTFMVCFSVETDALYIFMESVSLSISLCWIIINFRTKVLQKGVVYEDFSVIFNYYRQNGFYQDICGIVPITIAVDVLYQNPTSQGLIVALVVAVCRLTRTISAIRSIELYGKAEVIYNNYFLKLLKAFIVIFFMGHTLVCMLWLLMKM